MTIQILQGDAVEQLRTLPDQSVHCCVTSPPYDDARTYGQDKLAWDFQGTAKELYRVLVPGGIVCWNVNDMMINGSESLTHARQAIYFVDVVGFNLHDTMIYHRNGIGMPQKARYHSAFEYILILSKGSPRTFNPIKDRKNISAGQQQQFGENIIRQPDGSFVGAPSRQDKITEDFGIRTNVWNGNTRAQENPCEELPHPAMMPKWLARDLILSWSNDGDTILDPFMGSGTTLKMARELKRHSIGIEINPAYINIAKERLRLNEQLEGI